MTFTNFKNTIIPDMENKKDIFHFLMLLNGGISSFVSGIKDSIYNKSLLNDIKMKEAIKTIFIATAYYSDLIELMIDLNNFDTEVDNIIKSELINKRYPTKQNIISVAKPNLVLKNDKEQFEYTDDLFKQLSRTIVELCAEAGQISISIENACREIMEERIIHYYVDKIRDIYSGYLNIGFKGYIASNLLNITAILTWYSSNVLNETVGDILNNSKTVKFNKNKFIQDKRRRKNAL